MPILTLDADHKYFLDGKSIPGTNEIIGTFYDVRPWWATERDRRLGEVLHKCIAYLLEGDLDWKTVHPLLLPDVEAVAEWQAKNGYKAILIEKKLWSKRWFAGTIDSFGYFPSGRFVLPDWKRGAAGPGTALQTASYVELVCEYLAEHGTPEECAALDAVKRDLYPNGVERYALHNIGSGKPAMKPYKDRNDIPIFLGLVSAYHYGKNNSLKFYGGLNVN